MRQFYQKILDIWTMALENDVVTHEVFKVFCNMFFVHGGRTELNLTLFRLTVRSEISAKTVLPKTPEDQFMKEVYNTNKPIYKEFAQSFCRLYTIKLQGTKASYNLGSFDEKREILIRRYSNISLPTLNLKLSTKNNLEYKKMQQWKFGAIDDLTRLLIELERYECKINELVEV